MTLKVNVNLYIKALAFCIVFMRGFKRKNPEKGIERSPSSLRTFRMFVDVFIN